MKSQGKVREMRLGLKISGKGQGIRLTQEKVREISGKLFVSASLINLFLSRSGTQCLRIEFSC